MVTQYGIKYAVYIINSHFGNLVSKVCECLLRKGPLTMQQVVQSTGLSQQQAKNCLLVLVQHNCVQAFRLEQEGGFGQEARVSTQYIILFDNILHRMRFSKFLMIVSEEFDKNCMDLFEGLLQHGRLTVKQMLDRARGNQSGYDTIRGSLFNLVTARFVERCPDPDPFLPIEEEPEGKGRGAKSAKIIKVPEPLEQRVRAVAAQVESKRFFLPTSDENAVGENTDSPSVVGNKRKQVESNSEDKDGPSNDENILWHVNFEEFMCRLRHKACVEYVRAQFDDGTATVLGAMLEATRTLENKIMREDSVPLSISSILEEVMKSEEGRSMTVDRVKASLVQLDSVKGSDELYTVGIKNIIEKAQIEEVESIVFKRYGKDAYRIFRLLSKDARLMETDKISDAAFVDKQGATKILYNLWKDEYLQMERADVVPNKRFLLWKVNHQSLRKNVLDEMYHAALNLSLRVIHEKEKEKELFLLPPDKRVGHVKTRIDRLRKVCTLLESSLMKLDDAIMLFQNF